MPTEKSAQKLPEILSINTIARTQIFSVQSVDLRFSNGVVG